jgi:putative ABC transport system ATP-binding protein
MTVLKAESLYRYYEIGKHRVTALDGVNFEVEKGEFVAIMGPSGSGKSTLLHLLGGLDQPSKGEVTLDGQQLSGLSDKKVTLARRHNVGFVFQFFNLLPTLTAEENITLPLIIDGKKKRRYQERIDGLLDLVGLTDRRDHKPDQLSGGEQQRVALARALVTEPAIVLADEPTGNLDSKTGKAIMELLRRSCEQLNQAIVAVTHDTRAAVYSDRIVFLNDGKIIHELHLDEASSVTERLKVVMDAVEKLELEGG